MPPINGSGLGKYLTGTSGDDFLQGTINQDTLVGGAGSDTLDGGGDADLYLINWADAGVDTVKIQGADTVSLDGVGAIADLSLRYVQAAVGQGGFSTAGGTLYIGAKGGADKLILSLDGDFAGAMLRTSGGETVALTSLLQPLLQPIVGTDGADTLYGSVLNEVMQGGGGNDVLYGAGGNDTLSGGAGSDTLYGGGGQDLMQVKLSEAGQDTLVLGGETTIDILDDISLSDLTFKYVPDGNNGMDSFGALVSIGIAARNGQAAQADRLLVDLNVYNSAAGSTFSEVVLRNAKGEQASLKDMLAKVTLTQTGTSGNDIWRGTFANDVMDGGAGNDQLSGDNGNDSLTGGLGADWLEGGHGQDTLVGGKGNDTYNFARGDGRDLLIDKDSTWGNKDALVFSDARSDQLWLTRVGSDLNVAIIGTQDQVTIQGWFSSTANRVEGIYAGSDSKMLSSAKVSALVSAMSGFTNQAMAGTDLGAGVPSAVTNLISRSWTPA